MATIKLSLIDVPGGVRSSLEVSEGGTVLTSSTVFETVGDALRLYAELSDEVDKLMETWNFDRPQTDDCGSLG